MKKTIINLRSASISVKFWAPSSKRSCVFFSSYRARLMRCRIFSNCVSDQQRRYLACALFSTRAITKCIRLQFKRRKIPRKASQKSGGQGGGSAIGNNQSTPTHEYSYNLPIFRPLSFFLFRWVSSDWVRKYLVQFLNTFKVINFLPLIVQHECSGRRTDCISQNIPPSTHTFLSLKCRSVFCTQKNPQNEAKF